MSEQEQKLPKTVAILALGPSNREFLLASCSKKGFLAVDEIWTCNTASRAFRSDRIFVMDDLRSVERKFPEWAAELKTETVPILTCRPYPEYPTSVPYPIEEVKDCIKDDLFTTSVAYMIGLAIYYKVSAAYIYGADYWYPNAVAAESGLGCVGYLLGIAKERGVDFMIPNTSTLLDAHLVEIDSEGRGKRPLYGYDYNPGESAKRVLDGKATPLDKKVSMKSYKHLMRDERAKFEMEMENIERKRSNGEARPGA